VGSRGIETQTTRRSTRRAEPAWGRLCAYWDGGYADVELAGAGEVRVGRDAASELRIPHPSVSRHHALIRLGPVPSVEDLESANGTRVGGQAVEPGARTPLPEHAILELGDALLVLRQREQPSAAVSAPSSMRAVRELVERVAKGNVPITLVGETGVGKELLAESVHSQSPRRAAPFLRINCAALPEQLLESELFGYERGAFTGATQAKAGLLEAAHGGTVFLDEVGELPKAMQAKLLRALECKELFRVGSLRPRTFDVRFVAATNRDLGAMVSAGELRADLFHRLCGIVVQVPPLRERQDEVEQLARTFVVEVAAQLGKAPLELGRGFLQALHRHSWPGNVRELRHTMECAVLLTRGPTLEVEHLPRSVLAGPPRGDAPGSGLRDELLDIERRRILDALERCGGNQTRTAALLGIPRRTLIDRIEGYGLPRPRKKRRP